MKHIIPLLLAVISLTTFTSCEKQDAWEFDYPKDVLCGWTWSGTAINPGSGWTDITPIAFKKFWFTICFSEDGTYYGTGYFGNGTGTYTAKGKTIKTYVEGKLYCTYLIESIVGDSAEVTMLDYFDEPIRLRVRKY